MKKLTPQMRVETPAGVRGATMSGAQIRATVREKENMSITIEAEARKVNRQQEGDMRLNDHLLFRVNVLHQ